MTLFDMHLENFRFTHRPIRLFESFSGIGTQAMALKRLGVEVEHVGISEIDKYAIQSYNAIHGDVKNYGNIMDINGKDLPQIDLFTWSFPCTDLSKAGKQKGLNGTRSGLGYEVLRIISEMTVKPTVLVMENVPDLLSEKFKEGWREMFHEIENMGYTNYVEVLNAKNYGVAQNRERVFMVSILGEYAYEFPTPFTLDKRLKDYLENEVDEKYYLSDKQLSQISNWKSFQNPLDNVLDDDSFSPTITTRVAETDAGGISASMIVYGEPKPIIVGNLNPSGKGMNGNVWAGDMSPTITTNKGEGVKIIEPIYLNSKVNGKQPPLQERIYDSGSIATAVTTGFMPSIAIPEATEQGYALAQDGDGVYINRPHQKRGVVQKGMIQTIKAGNPDVGVVVDEENNNENYYNKILSILWRTITSQEIWKEQIRRFDGISKSEVLRQIMYEKSIFGEGQSNTNIQQFTHNCEDKSGVIQFTQEMRNMWRESQFRCSPQGRQLSEQFIDKLDDFMSKLSQQNTQRKEEMCYLWEYCKRFELLQQALFEIQKIWESNGNTRKGIRIRKLTPKEVWRLMGIDDEDFYKAQSVCSNSQLYKQAGNAIVVDVLVEIFGGMV